MKQNDVNALALAIKEEIESAKEAKPLKLHNLKRQENGLYVCITPLKLKGDGILKCGEMEIDVGLQASSGITVISGMEECEAEFIREAFLFQDQTTLLQKVADEFAAYKPNVLAEKLFSDEIENVSPVVINDESLNPAQGTAVGYALAASNTIVIGPAGTGKTKTIVVTIKELLAQGKRVLVSSHANLAVEGVFASYVNGNEDIAENDLVLSIDTDLPQLTKYSPKHIAEEKGKVVKDELDILNSALQSLSMRKRELSAIIEPANLAITSNAAMANDLERQMRVMYSEITALSKEKEEYEKRLARLDANGFLASIAAFVSSDKQDELKSLIMMVSTKMDSKLRDYDQLTQKVNAYKTTNANKAAEVKGAKTEMASIVIDETRIKERIAKLKEELVTAIGQDFFKDAKLAGVTLMSAATNKKIKDAKFDVIIIDEGSMANLPMILLAINCVSEKVIVFGDPMQLSPVAKTKNLKASLFDVLGITEAFVEGKLHPKALMLDTQFRCHPDIAELTSKLFYGGLLKNGRKVETSKKAMYIKNTHSAGSGFKPENGSYVNEKHQKVVMDQVRSALKKGQRSIGVISPFKAQASVIQNLFEFELREEYPDADFKAATIHSFQGQEKDVVIFDFTYGPSHKNYRLPQMLLGDIASDAAKLLNVATTRARDFFVLVVDQQYTHKMASELPNYEEQAVVMWLKGIEELAYRM